MEGVSEIIMSLNTRMTLSLFTSPSETFGKQMFSNRKHPHAAGVKVIFGLEDEMGVDHGMNPVSMLFG